MPYIEAQNRPIIDTWMAPLLQHVRDLHPGELNYVLTTLVLAWEPKRYADMEAVLGRLEAVKLEFYRRVVAPYEDAKKKINGDVFDGGRREAPVSNPLWRDTWRGR